jgi:hypothetical protein
MGETSNATPWDSWSGACRRARAARRHPAGHLTYRPFFMGYRSDASRVLHVAATRATGTRLATRTDGSPLAIVRYVMEALEESEMREQSSRKR